MLLDIAILIAVGATGVLVWSPRLHGSTVWRAMTTPLASIIGSGFLVLGPVLEAAYGMYAPVAMAALCGVAYLFGMAIRYNMDAHAAREMGPDGKAETVLETVASAALSFAYMISVAYYLNLFGAFAVSLTPFDQTFYAKLVTSLMFAAILAVGWTRGFRMLESLEYVSVSVKLAIIAGLLVGLGVYLGGRVADGGLVFNPARETGWHAITLGFGLIVTVQGFETSRYLGRNYESGVLVHSMRWAQWLSAAIYMAYMLLIAYVFEPGELELTETAIVDMMGIVAPILPWLLVAAALAAQFSAAVADTSGSGGLLRELSRKHLTARQGYAVLTAVGLGLTWTANVFEIISYASRAFAGYYTLQAVLASFIAWKASDRHWKVAAFAALAVLGLLIVVFGQPVEGSAQ